MTRLPSEIYERCLRHHQEVSSCAHVVRTSIPIPYFGDVAAYLDSPLRVVTVALNPSHEEFPTSGQPRFDVAQALSGPEGLEEQLSRYFQHAPYKRWFQSFEKVLNGMATSYGGHMSRDPHHYTALHLDLCSPIATSPTWSSLDELIKSTLLAGGRTIFEAALEALKPDLVLASLGQVHLPAWRPELSDPRGWSTLVRHEKSTKGQPMKPLMVRVRAMRTESGHDYLLANASAANTPFGAFSDDRKRAAGAALLVQLNATRID